MGVVCLLGARVSQPGLFLLLLLLRSVVCGFVWHGEGLMQNEKVYAGKKKLNENSVNEIDKESVRKEVRDFLPRARKGERATSSTTGSTDHASLE